MFDYEKILIFLAILTLLIIASLSFIKYENVKRNALLEANQNIIEEMKNPPIPVPNPYLKTKNDLLLKLMQFRYYETEMGFYAYIENGDYIIVDPQGYEVHRDVGFAPQDMSLFSSELLRGFPYDFLCVNLETGEIRYLSQDDIVLEKEKCSHKDDKIIIVIQSRADGIKSKVDNYFEGFTTIDQYEEWIDYFCTELYCGDEEDMEQIK